MPNEEIGSFKAALFGGFNRRDVLRFIELLYGQLNMYERENELLRKENGRLQAVCAASSVPAEQAAPEDARPRFRAPVRRKWAKQKVRRKLL